MAAAAAGSCVGLGAVGNAHRGKLGKPAKTVGPCVTRCEAAFNHTGKILQHVGTLSRTHDRAGIQTANEGTKMNHRLCGLARILIVASLFCF